ncbi:MAG: PQQ-binding-like beta-propeller repeat protein, partial [Acidobacteriota bacterium]
MRYHQSFHRLFVLIASILTITLGVASAPAADWTQFRGPDRNGISTETGLATDWPESGPTELWRQPIGDSFSGVVAIDGALFTTTSDEEGEFALRLDPTTGKTVWRTRLAPTFTDSFGNGPRITPTLDGDRLFVLSGGGHLTALGREKGDVRWNVDLRETFGAELPHWGFASAPLVLDELLILDVGAPDAAVVAFDKTDGTVRWKAGSGGGAYSSPAVHTIAGQRQLVLLRTSGLVGLSLDGKELWSHEWASRGTIKP